MTKRNFTKQQLLIKAKDLRQMTRNRGNLGRDNRKMAKVSNKQSYLRNQNKDKTKKQGKRVVTKLFNNKRVNTDEVKIERNRKKEKLDKSCEC